MAKLALNKTILDLHDAAGNVPMKAYRRWALQQMQQLVPCVRGYWACAVPDGTALHSVQTLHSEPLASENSLAGAQRRECRMLFDETASPRVIRMAELEPLSGLLSIVLLQRDAAQSPFTSAERDEAMLLTPHLLAAWRRCQQLSLLTRCVAEDGRVAALVDQHGFLHAADGRFFGMLRRHWTDWGGARLPEALTRFVAQGGVQVIENIRWRIEPLGELQFLSGEHIGGAALLTHRERSVAAAILSGHSYDVAANQLGISVNTLRNAIVRVYRKLGVNGKVELAQRLQLSLLTEI